MILRRPVTIAPTRTCPFCRDQFTAGGLGVECRGCRTLLHRDCWEEAGCTTLGCSGRRPAPRVAPRPARPAAPADDSPWSLPADWVAPTAPPAAALRRAWSGLTWRDREGLLGLAVLLGVWLLLALGLHTGALGPRRQAPRPVSARQPDLVTQEIR